MPSRDRSVRFTSSPTSFVKDRILKLAKRLNKFTLDEITAIAEIDEQELKLTLDNLEEVKKSGEVYLYQKKQAQKNNKNSSLRFKKDYHSPEDFELILKSFCLEIETVKIANLLNVSQNCVVKFYRHFRELIYKSQSDNLYNSYIEHPQTPRFRMFFGKTVYFYVYNNQVFINHRKLFAPKEKLISKQEERIMKMLYSKVKRKFLKAKHEAKIYHHIAEKIWRSEKSYGELLKELGILLGF